MSYRIRYTDAAEQDLQRLVEFLAIRDRQAARRASKVIRASMKLLQDFPFTCRKVDLAQPFLRELLISFGRSGYVALFEIDDDSTITITAVRHQREEDYH